MLSVKETEEKNTAFLFDIQHFSVGNGPGIRTTVFFKGCNLRCAWCHNPESQAFKAQMMFFESKCTGCGKCKEICENRLEKCVLCGSCAEHCPSGAREICGKEYAVTELFDELLRDTIFYKTSGGGVTFSGGECMLQIGFLEKILKECKKHGLHTAIDTAGSVPYDFFERILPYTDLFLYDVKCLDSQKHETYTGQGNELILDNLKNLLKAGKRVWVRIPVIPSVNDTEEEMRGIKAFLNACAFPEKVELLPYHAIGEHKHEAIGKTPHKFSVPSEEKMEELKKIFL